MGGPGRAREDRSSLDRVSFATVALMLAICGVTTVVWRGQQAAFASHVAPASTPSLPQEPYDDYDCVAYFDAYPNRWTRENFNGCNDDPAGFLSQAPPPTLAERRRIGQGTPGRDGGMEFVYSNSHSPGDEHRYVWVAIRNVGNRTRRVNPLAQFAWTNGSLRRSVGITVDPYATMPCQPSYESTLAPEPPTVYETSDLSLRPGQRKFFVIGFEDPPHSLISAFELHGRRGSPGILVDPSWETTQRTCEGHNIRGETPWPPAAGQATTPAPLPTTPMEIYTTPPPIQTTPTEIQSTLG